MYLLTSFRLDSQGLERKVSIQVENSMPEEETDLIGADGGRMLVDQSTYLLEVPESRRLNSGAKLTSLSS